MFTFKNFLTESLQVDKLKHLEHAEDHIIHGGNEGLAHAADTLEDLRTFLTGGRAKSIITTKYDGAPSIVFGINPENGKFFVASKSAFNKNPKINYTDADIEANHGHAPGLVAKLKAALKHLKKIMPKEGGVYQGDFMYEDTDLDSTNGRHSFTPNTITYSVDQDSPEGRKISNSKIGFVVHTKYKGQRGHHTKLSNMVAGFDVDEKKFRQDPDVNLISPKIAKPERKMTSAMQDEYQHHIDQATEAYGQMNHDTLDKLAEHDINIKAYINQTVRKGTKPSVGGYVKYLEEKREKEAGKLKTEKGQAKTRETYDTLIDGINKDKKEFEYAFDVHNHLQRAKDVLVKAMGNPTPYKNTVGGKEVKPEGFVATLNGRPTKIVDRAEFSRLNFANNRGKGEGDDTDVVPPEESETKKKHVMAFGRMNPPTTGHKVLVDKVMEVANNNGAEHSVVLSRSQDPENNPLTQEQKVKHAQRMFPGANIEAAGENEPTLIEQARKRHREGVDDLTVVAGSDRVEEFKKLLDKYNGVGEGKEFNFKRINVVSAGQRDPDAEGVEGMSASKMREHAINNRYGEFTKGIPSTMHPEHAKEMFNDVRKGMDIKIDANTNARSLARYALRQDIIGQRARKERDRRLREKEIAKAAKPKRQKKAVDNG